MLVGNAYARPGQYDIEVTYLNGKEMYLADTLSRAHLQRPSDCGQEEFETINAIVFLVMLEEKIHEIHRYTGEDTSLQQLKYNSRGLASRPVITSTPCHSFFQRHRRTCSY